MIWTRHTHVPGTHFSLGTTMLVSVLGLNFVVYGVVTMGDLLVVEREDGTLLRAKAIPNGMLGYLLGKVVNISGQIAFAVAITLLIGAFLFTGLAIGSPGSWLTLAWVLVLGLLATLPLGAVLGSLFPSQRSAGPWWLLLLAGLSAISGIFYPITHLPVFLQWTGQMFPVYWLGLGMRSALLPNAMAAVEIGHSVAPPGHVRRPVRVGGRGPRAGPGGAAADGAPRVRLDRRGPPRESAAGDVRSAGSGDKQATVKHCRVEIEEVAVALGPPAGCEVITQAVHCPPLGVRPDSGPDRHSAADMLVQVCLGPAPVGLVKAVSAVPRDGHRFGPGSDRAGQLGQGRPASPEAGVLGQVVTSQPEPVRVTGVDA